jgi:hypothetical protein
MFILYILFTIICCYLTYRFTCYQVVKLDKVNSKGFDTHQEYICKALDEIATIKTDVIKIKKDIYQ